MIARASSPLFGNPYHRMVIAAEYGRVFEVCRLRIIEPLNPQQKVLLAALAT
jgi:hypothetical protein